MTKRFIRILLLVLMASGLAPLSGNCQEKEILQSVSPDTTVTLVVDTSTGVVKKKRVYDPHKASVRSAILPGLGQIYNRKYWKLPIVYGALGVSGGIFVYNLKWYKRTRYAVRFLSDSAANPRSGIHPDLLTIVNRRDDQNLRYIRNQYRQSIDYSALIFLVLWGLNVVDAAVDAHLKGFDVSDDLTLKFKPGFSDLSNTAGMSMILEIGKKKPALVRSSF